MYNLAFVSVVADFDYDFGIDVAFFVPFGFGGDYPVSIDVIADWDWWTYFPWQLKTMRFCWTMRRKKRMNLNNRPWWKRSRPNLGVLVDVVVAVVDALLVRH